MATLRYQGKTKADIRFQDGALPHAVGVKTYQVMRACRNKPGESDGFGWTYNHAPMLAWWENRFFLLYLSDPVSEHVPPGQVFICVSDDAASWSFPKTIFPISAFPTAPFKGPNKHLFGEIAMGVPHHRMGFYVAKNGVLLASSFYGLCPEIHTAPNSGWGVGRVVCRVSENFDLSPVHFIKYNAAGGYTKENSGDVFPYYTKSADRDFVEACDDFLNNKLVTQQWWEEERQDKDFFTAGGAAALSYYTAKDDMLVGVYKQGVSRTSQDGGRTWTPIEKNPSIETATGKVWGQKTSDGKYALLYNPTTDGQHRWPIAVVTGEDGYTFDNMLAVTFEVAPQRYAGLMKNLGPQYLRGICESNPRPCEDAVYLTYSNNKEDIWISRIPVPVTGKVDGKVCEDFSEGFDQWNIYSPKWAPVALTGGALVLRDRDRYDRAIAERVVARAAKFVMQAKVKVDKTSQDTKLLIELCDGKGAVPVSLFFEADGMIYIKNSGRAEPRCAYQEEKWYELRIEADCFLNDVRIAISCEGEVIFDKTLRFSQSVFVVERVLFATKHPFKLRDLESNGHNGRIGDLPDSDTPIGEGQYSIGFFSFEPAE